MFSSLYHAAKLKIIFKTGNKLGNVFIGNTKRNFMMGTCEHLGIPYKTEKKFKSNASQMTVVRQDLETLEHQGDFDSFEGSGFC